VRKEPGSKKRGQKRRGQGSRNGDRLGRPNEERKSGPIEVRSTPRPGETGDPFLGGKSALAWLIGGDLGKIAGKNEAFRGTLTGSLTENFGSSGR